MRKFWVSFLGILGLFLLIGLAGTALTQVYAATGKGSPPLPKSTPAIVKSANSFDPGGVNIAQEAQTLAARWSASVINGAGWLHLMSRHDRNKDVSGTLPNGQPVLLNYIDDAWYQVDGQGKVLAAVTLQKDLQGQTRQVSILQDGVWQNLTLDTKTPSGEPSVPQLDYGFSSNAMRALSQGSVLSRQEKIVSGRAVLTFTIHEEFTRPVQLAGYKQPVVSVNSTATFDPQTGRTLYLERVLVMADGEQRLSQRTDILTVERVTVPPAHILELLNQEVTR